MPEPTPDILPPGSELDAAACEAMGWKPQLLYTALNGVPSEEVPVWSNPPCVSTDPTAMMECWNWLNKQGFAVNVVTPPTALAGQKQPYAKLLWMGRHLTEDQDFRMVLEFDGLTFRATTPAHALALAVADVGRVLKELGIETKEAGS